MSSTNRGAARNAADYYRTPISVVSHFLREWERDYNPEGFADIHNIIDPCAGGSESEPMSYPEAIAGDDRLFRSVKNIDTLDIRDDSPADYPEQDYLKTDVEKLLGRKPDLIITNPPFCLAREFIEKALSDVRQGGYVCFLLRLNYFESSGRRAFWHRQMPVRCYVHSERISFTANGKTDSVAYMHCIWRSGYKPESTMLKVI